MPDACNIRPQLFLSLQLHNLPHQVLDVRELDVSNFKFVLVHPPECCHSLIDYHRNAVEHPQFALARLSEHRCFLISYPNVGDDQQGAFTCLSNSVVCSRFFLMESGVTGSDMSPRGEYLSSDECASSTTDTTASCRGRISGISRRPPPIATFEPIKSLRAIASSSAFFSVRFRMVRWAPRCARANAIARAEPLAPSIRILAPLISRPCSANIRSRLCA